MVHQVSGDALTNPLGSVCRETEFQGIVKFPRSRKQADAALLNQIQQRHTTAGVLSGYGNHQPQIGIDHVTDGIFVAFRAQAGKLTLLLRCQQRKLTNFLQKLPQVFIAGAYKILGFHFQKLSHALIPFRCFIFSRSAIKSSSVVTWED